ncbi:MAG TPA: ABC transporter permease, partial [Thermoanaerobaculia bacterium]|nr:ABC transporter permease [Thermoanaerobaculia bacterium]
MERLLQDLRYGWRQLWNRPGLTAIAVASLALGIGANTTIFSLVDALLLRPLPVAAPERLVSIFTVDQKNPGFNPSAHANWRDLRDQNRSFSGVLGYDWAGMSVATGSGEPAIVVGQMVSGNYFALLGVHPALGHTFAPDDDREGAGRAVAVLSDPFWRERMGGEHGVLGRTISINKHPFTVIGVAPPEFTGTDVGGRPQLWVPMAINRQIRSDPALNWYGERRGLSIFAIGRLRPGATVARAQAEATALSLCLQHDFPKEDKGRRFKLVPLAQAAINPDARQGIVRASALLLVVVGLVLLIACANVANLLLARASARQKEIAVRLSVGAGRPRLIRQLLTESFLLSGLGGILGIAFALWAGPALLRLAGGSSPFSLDLRPDLPTLAFTASLALLTGIAFGLAPARRATRVDLASTLKENARSVVGSGKGAGRWPVAKLLVVGQFALSLLLLTCAGLFVRTLQNLERLDLGVDRDHILMLSVDPVAAGYTGDRLMAFPALFLERMQAIPGASAVTYSENGIFSGTESDSGVSLEGVNSSQGADGGLNLAYDRVGPDYFRSLRVQVLAGRDIGPLDRAGAPLV